MSNGTYLSWLIHNTKTKWWHDSAEQGELLLGLERGAVGVTTNPYLANLAIRKNRALRAAEIDAVLAQRLPAEQKAEALVHIVVTHVARHLMPEFRARAGTSGFVCGPGEPEPRREREPIAGDGAAL